MHSPQQQKEINHFLRSNGMTDLDDKNLFAQLAMCVRDHDHFRTILMKAVPEKRRLAYESLAPLLQFTAKPLADYELEARQLAESERLPGYNPETLEVIPFKPARNATPEEILAEAAIRRDSREAKSKKTLLVTCGKCTKEAEFKAKTLKKANYLLRQAGWILGTNSKGEEIEICPSCPAYRPAQRTIRIAEA